MSTFAAIDVLMQQANLSEITLRLHRVDGQLSVCVTSDTPATSKEYYADQSAVKANALRAEIAKSLNLLGSPAMLDQGFAQTLMQYSQNFAPAVKALTQLQSDLGIKAPALGQATNNAGAKTEKAAANAVKATPATPTTAQATEQAIEAVEAIAASFDDDDCGSL